MYINKDIGINHVLEADEVSKVLEEYLKIKHNFKQIDPENFNFCKIDETNCPNSFAPFLALLKYAGRKGLESYLENYKLVPDYEIDEPVTFFDYETNQYTEEHIDYGKYQHSIAGLLYLNKVEGGETVFPLQGLTVKPDPGKIICFPMNYTHPHKSLENRSLECRTVARFTFYPKNIK